MIYTKLFIKSGISHLLVDKMGRQECLPLGPIFLPSNRHIPLPSQGKSWIHHWVGGAQGTHLFDPQLTSRTSLTSWNCTFYQFNPMKLTLQQNFFFEIWGNVKRHKVGCWCTKLTREHSTRICTARFSGLGGGMPYPLDTYTPGYPTPPPYPATTTRKEHRTSDTLSPCEQND